MMLRVLVFSFVFAASSVAAKDVVFQSGEHESFTRLVATLPSKDTTWGLSRNGNLYTFKVDGDALNFKTDAVFSRIRRTRLAEITPNDERGEVVLQLSCQCRIESAPYNDRYVILDIRDGLPTDANSTESTLSIPLSLGVALQQDREERVFRFSDLPTRLSMDMPSPPNVKSMAEPLEASTFSPPPPRAEGSATASDVLALENYIGRNLKVDSLRHDLMEQVDRAADQNLLETTGFSKALASSRSSTSDERLPPQRSDIPAQPSTTVHENDLNIVAYNVIDEVGRDISALLSGRLGRGTCIPDSALNIAEWSGERSFVEELSALRKELVGEFDRTDPVALEKMARLYIHHTFGVEARQILNMLPKSGTVAVLDAMAQIVDNHEIQSTDNPFAEQGHCAGDAALWAALSGQRLVGESAVEAALDALNALPKHLREHLAPALSNRLVETDETEAAMLVLNAVERANQNPGPRFDLAHATLDNEIGKTEAATTLLTKVANDNSDVATVAVVDLINSHVKQDIAPTSDTVSLVGALAVEHKTGAMGPDLRRAHALSRMLTLEFEPAFRITQEISLLDGEQAATKVRSQLSDAMIKNLDEFDLVAIVLSQHLSAPGALNADASLRMSEKMFDLGFFGEAKRLLQAAQETTFLQRRRLLMARVALADNLPKRAEAEILGIDTPEAEALRARARSQAGDHQSAATLLAKLGDTQSAEEQVWLGGDLSALNDATTEVYRATSEYFSSEANTSSGSNPDETIGILARNKSLLQGSEQARSVVEELLQWHAVPEPSS